MAQFNEAAGATEPVRLVVLARLQPGDVVLSAGTEAASRVIKLGAGTYSHAAVFTGSGLLEATYDDTFSGVRLTLPKSEDWYVGQVDGSLSTLWAIRGQTRYDVYRFVARTPEEAAKCERLRE